VRLIPFTEYVLPHGRRQMGGFQRPDEVADKASAIRKAGYRFEAEVLSTGHVSLTIVGCCPRVSEESDVAIEIAMNGPEVTKAVDRMILGFEIPEAGK